MVKNNTDLVHKFLVYHIQSFKTQYSATLIIRTPLSTPTYYQVSKLSLGTTKVMSGEYVI